jgi:hypothetical protein
VTVPGFFFGVPMSDNTKAILGAIIAAPVIYFLLIVLMSF